MKKIPMLLAMDFDDKGNRVIMNKINPKVKDIITNDMIPTRKLDGTAVMFDGDDWFARRSVKKGKNSPDGFILLETDPNNGHSFGWEPMMNSAFKKFFMKALDNINITPATGDTFELIGPKINNNPENVDAPTLVKHGSVPADGFPTMIDILAHEDDIIGFLRPVFVKFREDGVEGVVWWVNDNPVMKLRVKDFFPEDDSRFKK